MTYGLSTNIQEGILGTRRWRCVVLHLLGPLVPAMDTDTVSLLDYYIMLV